MADDELPPCGLYKTTVPLGPVPAGRLVYFHNHGDPGPGVYLPQSWRGNRATWEQSGHTLETPSLAATLEALEPEGLYVVEEVFHCCEKKCRRFEPDALIQVGYDRSANTIVFEPELVDGGILIPEKGVRVEQERLKSARLLIVRDRNEEPAEPTGLLH